MKLERVWRKLNESKA